uniref:Ribonuclease A-domain domain-containing protein n=1 Tax=Neolamprologus brichardi TaxID=32507 RepID=A0A3Q4HDP3_NEOBR
IVKKYSFTDTYLPFLLMLPSVILVWSVPPKESLFEIQHIAKKEDKCDNLMNKEKLKCKPRNTFIIGDVNVQEICNQKPVYDNLYASHEKLKMLHCKLIPKSSPCKYEDIPIELHAPRRHLCQMPEPPQLPPFDVEEQRLYSEPLPDG